MGVIKENLSCEKARFLLSRNLDGDLSRDEVRQLFQHIGLCDSCRDALVEMEGLETNLESLNQVYEGESLSDSFNKDIMDRLKQEENPRQTEKVPGFLEWVLPKSWVSSAFPGLIGAMAGILLFIIVWPNGKAPLQNTPRFQLHPVEFHEAKEKIIWNHNHTLLPGHTLRKTVIKGHDQPYHFRFQSDGPVNIVVTHDILEEKNDPRQKITLHGIRYASLNKPQKQDIIIIRNEGNEPVHISAYTENPGGIRAKVKEYGKTT